MFTFVPPGDSKIEFSEAPQMGGIDSRLSPHLSRGYELLADGAWHDREPVIIAMVKVVPPGVALRAAERRRTYRNKGPRRAPRSLEFQIATGARSVCVLALSNAPRVERRNINNVVQIRLRPAVPSPTQFRSKNTST